MDITNLKKSQLFQELIISPARFTSSLRGVLQNLINRGEYEHVEIHQVIQLSESYYTVIFNVYK